MPKALSKAQFRALIKKNIKEILIGCGYDLAHEDFKRTPDRVAELWAEEFLPLKVTKKLFSVFPSENKQMITLRNHETWSRCPHHLEKVKLKVTIGYVPNGRVMGLSKLARIADMIAKDLIIQENFVEDTARALMEALKPQGVGVYAAGEHLCMRSRGVKTTGDVVTTALYGVMFEDARARAEFLMACEGGR